MDFAWEWTSYTKDGKLKWNRYSSSVINTLESAYKQKQKDIYLPFNGYMYYISFQNNTQLNLSTNKKRYIRRRDINTDSSTNSPSSSSSSRHHQYIHTDHTNHENSNSLLHTNRTNHRQHTNRTNHRQHWSSIRQHTTSASVQITNFSHSPNFIIRFVQHHEFRALHSILHTEPQHMNVLQFVFEMCTKASELFTQRQVPLSLKSVESIVMLSQKQCCCLLSLAFFDVAFQNTSNKDTNGKFTLRAWLIDQPEKLKCILEYFNTMYSRSVQNTRSWGSRKVIFFRKVTTHDTNGLERMLSNCHDPLKRVRVLTNNEKIEDAKGTLQADFANEFIGGGVLRHGCVQEEIRFTISPECLVSVLICERMQINESIVIIGAERFCRYTGYGRTFKYVGKFNENVTEIDSYGALNIRIVAFDALDVQRNPSQQYSHRVLSRDMLKLYSALSPSGIVDNNRSNVFSTGNWGCGVFGGDPKWKFMQQWIIASFTNKTLHYYTYKDPRLHALDTIHTSLIRANVTVSQLYRFLLNETRNRSHSDLFRNIMTHFNLR